MKVINIVVDEETFRKLETGELVLDVRIDEIHKGVKHDVGDMLIYSARDDESKLIEDKNLAFMITTKVALETFVQRIGEQIMTQGRKDNSDDLVIVTLAPV